MSGSVRLCVRCGKNTYAGEACTLCGAPGDLSAAEARWLTVLEAHQGYCTDDEDDRVALARVLAAVPSQLTPAEFKDIIATSIKGFVSAAEPMPVFDGRSWIGLVNLNDLELLSRLAQHLCGNIWMALQSKGVLPF